MPAKGSKLRTFPKHALEEALALPQEIQDERGGKPFRRLLLADALGAKPSSSHFRDLLSSANKYGLTEGNEKTTEISLTKRGENATQTHDSAVRLKARREATLTPSVFERFFTDYADKKLPSAGMMAKILAADYGVPDAYAEACGEIILANGRFCDLIRDIGGSPHVLLDTRPDETPEPSDQSNEADEEAPDEADGQTQELPADVEDEGTPSDEEGPDKGRAEQSRPIFIGHGKNKKPLSQLQQILTAFQIPHKIAQLEANLGRPIPTKVKEVMRECGSAILIFTKDEEFFDKDGNEVWRPSENVVHELGAASFLYEDRLVIFKEEGIYFPANYQSIGYIEFGAEGLEAKTTDLLKELIGFGLVRITPA